MGYRTVKRVLGESNLERKCRRLFGVGMLLIISGSFYVYSRYNDRIVLDQNRFLGEVVLGSALTETHARLLADNETSYSTEEKSSFKNLFKVLANRFRRRSYRLTAIYPLNQEGVTRPQDQFELDLLEKWVAQGKDLDSDAAIEELEKTNKPWQQRPVVAATTADAPGGQSAEPSATYQYYEPVFAKQVCVDCHRLGVTIRQPNLKVGDLLAVLRAEMDVQDVQDQQAGARALLITLGLFTVTFAMAVMHFVVKYVIGKPLTHLRDVSDAVRRGEVESRAVIHTGDEFEELGAAFNRMLRQLLRQQDELRDVNDELDGKIDELAQVNMRLFETNKVKSDFLATVSHELRTPLNSILGFSDLLAKSANMDDKHRRYAGNIERSGRQLLDMINDILDLAKIESGRMEIRPAEFDVGSVTMTQCDLARPLSERKNIELDCEIAADLPPIFQDQGKIEQILNNLLSNAIKFTPEGGRIHVTAKQDRRGDLRLIVADTGVGISESEQTAVFEKFRQGSNVLSGGTAMTREYSGTGLGLSIVRELCRLLGGDVTLESEVGKGSEFTVILPWSLPELTKLETPLADELRQLANSRSDAPVTAARIDAGGEI
jgi:signal transduction histidine kinase